MSQQQKIWKDELSGTIFVNAPNQDYSQAGINQYDRTYPIGLLQTLEFYRRYNVDERVNFLDGNFYTLPVEDIVRHVVDNRFSIVGINATFQNAEIVGEISRRITQESQYVDIIVGGPAITLAPEEILEKTGAHFGVLGEGEVIFEKLVEYLNHSMRSRVKEIDNLVYKKSDSSVETTRRDPILDLDSKPFIDPKWIPKEIRDKGVITMSTSRGCPRKCTYCSTPGMYGSRIWYQSPKRIIAELAYSWNNGFKFHEAHFVDDNFAVNWKRTAEFAELFKEYFGVHGVTYRFVGDVIELEEEQTRILKESGLSSISIGIESGNQETLNRIGKGLDLGKLATKLEYLKKNDIRVKGFFMLGIPGEDSIDQTIKLAEELFAGGLIDQVGANVFMPYPGTKLADEVEVDIQKYQNKGVGKFANPMKSYCNIPIEDLLVARDYLNSLIRPKEPISSVDLPDRIEFDTKQNYVGAKFLDYLIETELGGDSRGRDMFPSI